MLSEDGRKALLKLSRGDMRRALNVLQVRPRPVPLSPPIEATRLTLFLPLQACHAAYDLTDETAVYRCTGNPEPRDIDEIMNSMMNDSFEVAYQRASRSLCPLLLRRTRGVCVPGAAGSSGSRD